MTYDSGKKEDSIRDTLKEDFAQLKVLEGQKKFPFLHNTQKTGANTGHTTEGTKGKVVTFKKVEDELEDAFGLDQN